MRTQPSIELARGDRVAGCGSARGSRDHPELRPSHTQEHWPPMPALQCRDDPMHQVWSFGERIYGYPVSLPAAVAAIAALSHPTTRAALFHRQGVWPTDLACHDSVNPCHAKGGGPQ